MTEQIAFLMGHRYEPMGYHSHEAPSGERTLASYLGNVCETYAVKRMEMWVNGQCIAIGSWLNSPTHNQQPN